MFKRTSAGFVSGLVLGLAIVGVLLATDTRVHDSTDAVAHDGSSGKAVSAFVSDWQRMRTGTWTVDSKFIRSNGSGQTLTSDVHEAQRPPQRSRTSFGTTTIELPGRTISCAPAKEGQKGGCREAPSRSTFDESVHAELETIRMLVSGTSRKYAVTRISKHCYELRATSETSGAWGQNAKFCFDARTGATVSSEIVQSTSADRIVSSVTATSIRNEVNDSDFTQPQPAV